jgi:hypothetical protein
LDNCDADHLA